MVQKIAEGCEITYGFHISMTGKPAVYGYLFQIREGKRDGLHLSSTVPLTPTAPTAVRLWETFTLLRKKANEKMK